jgi:hypothetical protein
LADQEIRLDPRKMQNPIVERLSSRFPAQSESQKALRETLPLR